MGKADQYKCFIVHLQRAAGRKQQVQALIEKSPYATQVVDAVDGSLLSDQEIARCYQEKPIMTPDYPFKLNVGEMGCFLSHRAVWQEIVAQDLAAGLIFEDDVHIDTATFANSVKLAEQHVSKLGYIQFQVREIADVDCVLAQNDDCKIVRPMVTPLRTSAQFVSRATVEKLLDITATFDRPIDGVLQLYWETGLQISCVIPSGVSDRTAQTGGSTLSSKQPLRKKLAREFHRNKYKRAVRRLSNGNNGRA